VTRATTATHLTQGLGLLDLRCRGCPSPVGFLAYAARVPLPFVSRAAVGCLALGLLAVLPPAASASAASSGSDSVARADGPYLVEPVPADVRPVPPRVGAIGGVPRTVEDSFALHSDPDAAVTIYLDFDGATLSGTAWNELPGIGGSYASPAWTLDGDPAFTARELEFVYGVWAAVASDFAPFEVDVTTEDPGVDAITRTSVDDTTYGSRVLVTQDTTLEAAAPECAAGCGGLTHFGTFDEVVAAGSQPSPALVFAHRTGNGAGTAALVSHEVGHHLSLSHDGINTGGDVQDRYAGTSGWAPIMGAGNRALSQWSAGDYAGATNTEDDLAIIASHGPALRADEAPGTLNGSFPPAAPAYITSEDDADVYLLPPCNQQVTAVAAVDTSVTNLDVTLELLDADGDPLTSPGAVDDDPLSIDDLYEETDRFGLSGKVSAPAGQASYVRVSGGSDLAFYGYSAYGSVGDYTLRTQCGTGMLPPTPRFPRLQEVRYDTFFLSWEPPATPVGSVVTGYRVTSGDSVNTYPAGTRIAEVFAFREQDYRIEVAAIGPAGVGSPAVLTGRPTQNPFAIATTTPNLDAGTLTYTWTAPVINPGQTATGWRANAGAGAGQVDLPLATRTATITGLTPGADVTARTCLQVVDFGDTCRRREIVFGRISTAPTDVAVQVSDGVATLTWDEPTDLGDGDLDTYEWSVDGGAWTSSATTSVELPELAPGTHQAAVRAITDAGIGAVATTSYDVAVPPEQIPLGPTQVRATAGDRSATVRWTAPSSGADVVGYVVTTFPGGARREVAGDTTSVRVTGLRNGTSYRFAVSSVGELAESEPSARTAPVVPAGRPGQVSGVKATSPKKRTVRVTWTPPSANGSPITRYTVKIGKKKVSVAGSKKAVTVKRLRPGRYRVTVVATNAVGAAKASRAVKVRVR
jgi:hypothetical protein